MGRGYVHQVVHILFHEDWHARTTATGGRTIVPMRHLIALGSGFSVAAAATIAGSVGVVQAHGSAAPAPDLLGLLTTWSLEPLPWLGSLAAAGAYLFAFRRVNGAHPRTPTPRWRAIAWLAGLAVILVALTSAIDPYAEELLTVHMVQHLLLTMIAPPLLALGAPVTLLLRAASPSVRRRTILPVLHSLPIRLLASAWVAWPLFSLVMWATHFSPLYDAALENQAVHDLEHVLYLASGALFWWPVVAADPIPGRLRHGARMAYLLLQMPVGAAVGLVIWSAPIILYPHYATSTRTWGPSPLDDQQIGGLLMWAGGDLVLLAAVAFVVAAWIRSDVRRSVRIDERARRTGRATVATRADEDRRAS